MNLSCSRSIEWQEHQTGSFEVHGPSSNSFCRAFVHGCADIPYHWHREMEIVFVLRGSLRMIVNGQVCEMGTDELIIINGNVPHNSISTSRDALICGVHLDTVHFERMGLPGFAARQYRCRTFLHSGPFMAKVAAIKSFIARIILEQADRSEEALIRHATASLLACYIYRWIPYDYDENRDAKPRAESRNRVLRIMSLLGRKGESPQLNMIAAEERVTISHLSRLFKLHVGIGYRDYSQNLRLDNCAAELRTTKDTVSVVMTRNGFGNPAVFYNKFRARFGCSPSDFRQGGRLFSPQSLLTDQDEGTARELLSIHASTVGKAAEMAIGLTGPKRRILLNALHGPDQQSIGSRKSP